MLQQIKQQNANQKDGNMESQQITPETVKELYKKLDNKQFFIAAFGTTKFHLVSKDFLIKMYKYLIRKVK
jgi:hypothetical protein